MPERCLILNIPDQWPYWRFDYLLRIATYNTDGEIETDIKGNRVKISGNGPDIVAMLSNIMTLRDPGYNGLGILLRDGDKSEWRELNIPSENMEAAGLFFNYALLDVSENL